MSQEIIWGHLTAKAIFPDLAGGSADVSVPSSLNTSYTVVTGRYGCCVSTRIQSRPGKRILWRTISPIMHPTDHISTARQEVRQTEGGGGREESKRLVIDHLRDAAGIRK